MSTSKRPGTMKQWAAREAPTISAEGWANANELMGDAELQDGHADDQVEECRALLAYRDLHAAELSRFHRRVLLGRGDQ